MGKNKGLKCRCQRQQQLKKFKNQMLLPKTTAIESNSNLQFVIATFKLLKEKILSRITAFVKHTSFTEKQNSLFFFPLTLFRSKTLKDIYIQVLYECLEFYEVCSFFFFEKKNIS